MLRRAVVGLLFVAPLAVAQPRPSTSGVTGNYQSNWDAVQLVQNGTRVTGTYVCCGGGTIEGKIYEGSVIRYRWTQPSGSGLGVWKIQPGRLTGTWGTGNDAHNGGRWDLERADQIAN